MNETLKWWGSSHNGSMSVLTCRGDEGEKSTGIASFIRRGGRLPRLHRRGPLKIHSGPLQPRPEWGGMLEPGGAGPGPEKSVRPRLFGAPAGRHQTSDD